MDSYSEKDRMDAAAFRNEIHQEALAKVRKIDPAIEAVVDRYPIEAYFDRVWDYPGAWYPVIGIPKDAGSRERLIDSIVRDTLMHYPDKGSAQDESTAHRQTSAVGEGAVIADDSFDALISAYPDVVIDYIFVQVDVTTNPLDAHRIALNTACKKLFFDSEEGESLDYDIDKATAEPIAAQDLFTSDCRDGRLSYRRAFLSPPYKITYTEKDFNKVNAALFPNGTDDLAVYRWSTDWAEYFDDGNEWWGALCCTVYDKTLDRFVVIMASATD